MAGNTVKRWCQRVSSVGSAVFLAAGISHGAQASSDEMLDVSLDYTIYASGLRVATGTVGLTLDPGAYAIDLVAEPRGVIAWLTRWQYDANSTGVLEGQETRPLAYETQRQRRNRDRKFRVAYDDQGPIQEVHDPPRVLQHPVPADDKLGSLDPLSATVALIRGASIEGECPSDLPVYDGRRRFDVKFVESEVVELTANRFSAFQGAAIRCRLQFDPIAGDFDSEDRSSFWYAEAIAERQIDMWLAPVLGEGTSPIPVKLQGLGRFGPFYIHLSGINEDASAPDGALVPSENAEG